MKIPHKKTVVDTELGVPHATSGKTTDDGKKSADYSANASHALTVPPDCGGLRLDQALVRLWPKHSRNRLQNWIREGRVSVGGQIVSEPKHKLWGGESLELVEAPDEHVLSSAPEAIALNIVHEDDTLIVLDKPAGLVVHPGSGNWSGTLLNALLHHEPSLEMVPRAGIVHRLDKDTTGLLVVARTDTAQTHLVRQLQARSMGREYVALVHGQTLASGTVDRAIGRDPRVPVRMAVERPIAPKPAVTHYVAERVGRLDDAGVTQLACRLETGRTHQIRVHLASLNHPLLGDTVYGGRLLGPAQRQMLHARRLTFVDPASGENVCCEAPLPADMTAVLDAIAW